MRRSTTARRVCAALSKTVQERTAWTLGPLARASSCRPRWRVVAAQEISTAFLHLTRQCPCRLSRHSDPRHHHTAQVTQACRAYRRPWALAPRQQTRWTKSRVYLRRLHSTNNSNTLDRAGFTSSSPFDSQRSLPHLNSLYTLLFLRHLPRD